MQGSAEAFANDLEFDAEDYDIDTELLDASNFSVKDLLSKCSSPNTFAALIMASYGEGEPTDNAKSFMSAILDDKLEKSAFKSCNYSVFGLGNSQCFPDRYNIVAKQLDDQLKMLGANQVVELGLGDASGDMSGTFEEWKEKMISAATATPPPPSTSASSTTPVTTDTSPSLSPNSSTESPVTHLSSSSSSLASNTSHPDTAVLSPRQLALIPSSRIAFLPTVTSTVQHFLATDEFTSAVSVSFDVSDCQSYATDTGISTSELTKNLQAGDHIGVFAPNSTLMIKRFAANAQISDEQLDFPLNDENQASSATSSRLCDVLKWEVQLSGPVPITTLKILLRWSKAVSAVQSGKYLSGLISDYDNAVRKRGLGIASVLAGVCAPHTSPESASLPITSILKSLPVISPRLYSLTNDPEAVTATGSVTLLSRLLRYRDGTSGTLVSGLCSSYLCEQLKPSDQPLIFFRESNFHLPMQEATPVIMIGGGSGIAPFLSFLESRANSLRRNSKDSLGPAVLYFGCRNTNEYMFRSELQHHLEIGSLSRLVVAFSDSDMDSIATLSASAAVGEEIYQDKCNITDRVNADNQSDLKDLMQHGAYVYVCGGAGNFGLAVRDSVEQLVQVSCDLPEVTTTGRTEGESVSGRDEGVRLLVNQKRYFEDLAD